MTGYAYAKILKYREVDDLFQANKRGKGGKGGKGKKDKKETVEEWFEAPASPNSVKNLPINLDHAYWKSKKNFVMCNQFDNCMCFHMNPSKPDQSALESVERHKNIVWIKFKEEFNCSVLSAQTIADLFSSYGDF